MGGTVELADLIDGQRVAGLLGLSQSNTVSRYQRRHSDVPCPVIDLGRGGPRLWLRWQVVSSMRESSRVNGRTAQGRRS